jgi:tetratricopeptide (TPR) repeat protein
MLVSLIREHTTNYAERSASLRIKMCRDLTEILSVRWKEHADDLTLQAILEVKTELLHLCCPGHPEQASYSLSLAESLLTCFQQTGDNALLNEVIELDRDALALRPGDHPDRHFACHELACALWTRFRQTGDDALLDEAIKLDREAITLRPVGHPNRHLSCNNLACALSARFRQTGDGVLLDEAIQLQREALSLRPAGHPSRHISCNNVAHLLWTRFRQTKDDDLLTEAIQLHRQALALRPPGHRSRHLSCHNLANAIWTRFQQTEDIALLEEAIQLHREALVLQPVGYPDRHRSCSSLAICLVRRLSAGDTSLSAEITDLLDEALLHTPVNHPGRWCIIKQHVHLALYHMDHAAAVFHLHDMLTSPISDVPALLDESLQLIKQIDLNMISDTHQQKLLQSYGKALELVTLSAGFALDRSAQLDQAVSNTFLGPHAFMLSNRVNDLPLGLQLLERARGVIWSQMLQIRDPQISRAPADSASKLEAVICSMDPTRTGQTEGSSARDRSFLSERDVLHQQRSQLQQVLRDIRCVPGLHDFMCGPDSHTLVTAAARNPVVMLVADEKECHALIIKSPLEPLVNIRLEIPASEIRDLTLMDLAPQQRGSLGSSTIGDRAMHVSKRASSSCATLAKLWRAVVNPIITHLNFTVSESRHILFRMRDGELTPLNRNRKGRCDHAFTGVRPARLCSFRCMQQGSTKATSNNVVLTTPSHHTRQLLLLSCEHSDRRRRIPLGKRSWWLSPWKKLTIQLCHLFTTSHGRLFISSTWLRVQAWLPGCWPLLRPRIRSSSRCSPPTLSTWHVTAFRITPHHTRVTFVWAVITSLSPI